MEHEAANTQAHVGKQLFLEQVRAYYRDMKAVADNAPYGQVVVPPATTGACKNLIGKRLKQTGAKWRVRRVNNMATLCAIHYGGQWKTYWNYAK